MTHKTSLPKPEAFLYVNGEHRGVSLNFRSDMELSEGTVRHALITTDQAEAYADARVREALEKAAAEAKRVSDKYDYGYYGSEVDAVDEVGEAIRALLPATE